MQPEYQTQRWYEPLTAEEKATVQDLINAQTAQGNMLELGVR